MTTYRITNTRCGIDFGLFEGATEHDALDDWARCEGFADYTEMNSEFPVDDGEILVLIEP